MPKTELSPAKPRRSYSKELKAQIVMECGQPNVSIAAVAQAHGINTNLVHKWIRQSRARAQAGIPSFVPVISPPMMPLPNRHIEIRLQRGEVQATLQWPASEAAACATWLREWLR